MELICYTKSSSHTRTGYKVSNQCSKLQWHSVICGQSSWAACAAPVWIPWELHGRDSTVQTSRAVPTQTSCCLVSSGTQSNSQAPGNVLTASWGEIMASSTWQGRKAAGRKGGRKETQVYMGDTLQSKCIIPTLGHQRPGALGVPPKESFPCGSHEKSLPLYRV